MHPMWRLRIASSTLCHLRSWPASSDTLSTPGRAYEPDGLAIEEFDASGPTARTLRQFIGSYQESITLVRDFMLPNPDVRASVQS